MSLYVDIAEAREYYREAKRTHANTDAGAFMRLIERLRADRKRFDVQVTFVQQRDAGYRHSQTLGRLTLAVRTLPRDIGIQDIPSMPDCSFPIATLERSDDRILKILKQLARNAVPEEPVSPSKADEARRMIEL